MNEPWFDPNTFGPWFGAAGGIWGGIVGTAVGILVPKGKAKHLVLALLGGTFVLGVGTFVVGVVAIFNQQPVSIWLTLCIAGALFGLICGAVTRGARRAYAQIEKRHKQTRVLRLD